MKIVVCSLGCKVNQIEGQSIAAQLCSWGYSVSDKWEYADAYVLNTCAVTSEAARKSRQMISKARSFNAHAQIFVCGCASQEQAHHFDKTGVRFVAGTKKQDFATNIHKMLTSDFAPQPDFSTADTCEQLFAPISSRTRAFIKVQDGCENFCSYCIVPYLRGKSRSKPIEQVVAEVQACKSEEVVISGINLSDYGRYEGKSLKDLCKAIAHQHTRIRLGSLEANVIDQEFLQILQEGNFCPHLHLSLQSACDSVLARMNRKYTVEQFAQKIDMCKAALQHVAITTDVIVGFSGETDSEHEQSLQGFAKMGFADAHIFVYSQRAGTKAALMPQVDAHTKQLRAAQFRTQAQKDKQAFAQQNSGKQFDVLFEECKNNMYYGYTPNYIKVAKKSPTDICGKIISVKLD